MKPFVPTLILGNRKGKVADYRWGAVDLLMGFSPLANTYLLLKMYIIGSLLVRLVTFRCIISFISQRRHLLICLLGLEGILLGLMLIYFTFSSPGDLFILFSILRFAACEASLGLSCLVIIVRSYGSDIFSSLRGYKC